MNLKEKTLVAVKWNLLSTILTSTLGVLSLWILSHLLTTQDYGVISASLIISAFFSMLLDFGISNSIIRSAKITKSELSSLYVINIVLGALIFLITFLFSGEISRLFNANQSLTSQIRVMSLGFVIISFGLQPKALLTREMNFAAIAKITIVSTIINFLTVTLLSYLYRSPWCIAVAFLVSATVNAVLLKYAARSLMRYEFSFSFASVKKHIRYGVQLVMDSLINQVSINTYPVIMSRVISLTAIGGYNIAYSISIALFEKLNPVLSHALFPAFSKISDDETRLQSSFLKVTTFSAMINFPMLLGMMVIAQPLVQVFFDQKWHFITPVMQVLCITGAIRSLDVPVISLLLVKAQMYRNIFLGVVKIALGIPLTWWLGHRVGLIGIVYGFLIIQLFNTIAGYFFLARPSAGISGRGYLKSVFTPVFHVLPMVLIGLFVRNYSSSYGESVSLIVTIAVCLLVYIGTVFVSPVNAVQEFKEIVTRNLLKRVKPS